MTKGVCNRQILVVPLFSQFHTMLMCLGFGTWAWQFRKLVAFISLALIQKWSALLHTMTEWQSTEQHCYLAWVGISGWSWSKEILRKKYTAVGNFCFVTAIGVYHHYHNLFSSSMWMHWRQPVRRPGPGILLRKLRMQDKTWIRTRRCLWSRWLRVQHT